MGVRYKKKGQGTAIATGDAGSGPTSERASSSPLLIPLAGILESGAAKIILSTPVGTALRLVIEDNRIYAYGRGNLLGWLDPQLDTPVRGPLSNGVQPQASLYCVEGTPDEPTALVAVRV